MNNILKILLISNTVLIANAVNKNIVGLIVKGLPNNVTITLHDNSNPQHKITVGNGTFVLPDNSFDIQLKQNAYNCTKNTTTTNILVTCNEQPFTTLYRFSGPDGANPSATLTTAGDSKFLYGTTDNGGNGYGTIFKLNPTTGELTTLYKFSQMEGGFKTSSLTMGTDGLLYGTTEGGGNFNLLPCPGSCGTIFRLNPTTGEFTTIYKFSGTDGYYPDDSAVTIGGDGFLYGTTSAGYFPHATTGTIFKLNIESGEFTTLFKFNYTIGTSPQSTLATMGNDGFFYGTTFTGGINGGGIIYKINPITGELTTLFNFSDKNLNLNIPNDLLAVDNDASLYGTLMEGGNNACLYGCGGIFKINSTTNAVTVLYQFSGSDGANPYLSLVTMANDGFLYGTTNSGGLGYGTIFKINRTTGEFTSLYKFGGADGANPQTSLTPIGTDGFLYGTTNSGGLGYGTIFKINPNLMNKAHN